MRFVTSLFLVVSSIAPLAACTSSTSDDPSAQTEGAALSSSNKKDIKHAAKASIQNVMALDAKGKFVKASKKDLQSKGVCFELIADMLPGDRLSPLNHVKLHAVGRDGQSALAAASKECDVVISNLKSSCSVDPSSMVIHTFDKKECDGDNVYVGLVGEDKTGEDALGGHHRYDEYKNAALRIGWDDSIDFLDD